MTTCTWCEDFGYRPVGIEPGWYQRDWRLLLDPTIGWERCSACRDDRQPLAKLHERLSQRLVGQLDADVKAWQSLGEWRRGVADNGQIIWRWRDVAILPPGPVTNHVGWLAASPLGVQRDLDHVTCGALLKRLGAPVLPRPEDE